MTNDPAVSAITPVDTIGKLKRYIAQFRSLGGIPEMCDLAWKLCCENEELKAEIERLRASLLSSDRAVKEPDHVFVESSSDPNICHVCGEFRGLHGVAASPARPQLQKIREHLSAVEGSPDWADLAEILDWYKCDVSALLALLAEGAVSAAPPATDETE